MSKKDRILTQKIADLAFKISQLNGMGLEEALNFVYNSEVMNEVLCSEKEDFCIDNFEPSLLNELKYAHVTI